MTWTYSGNPSASSRDEVRFLIGDTATSDQQVTDEEITYAVTATGDARQAAIRLCLALSAKYARLTDTVVDDVQVRYSQRSQQYRDLATALAASPTATGGVAVGPWAGSLSQDWQDTVDADDDLIPAAFRVGMHDASGWTA